MATTTTLAFGSCHKNKKSAIPPIWDAIGRENANAWIWTGDAMYPSSRDPLTGRKRYGPASPSELERGFTELRTNATIGYKPNILLNDNGIDMKVYGTWDDHDYGGNDMGKEMKDREERKKAFFDFMGYDNPPQHPGVYHSVDINQDVQLILLDTRWFREEHCIKSAAHVLPMGNAVACGTRWLTAGLQLHKLAWLWGSGQCQDHTILGSAQWNWLEESLLKSSAKVHIIVSSIQVWSTNPAMESWGQFPSEQKRLHDLLQRHYQQSPTSPVIMLSGDVHHAEIINTPESGLLEVTSSGLTHHCGQPFGYGKLCRPILNTFRQHRHNINDYFIGLNYGILKVNETGVTIQIKDKAGATALQVTQPLDNKPISLPPFEELPRTWNGHMIPWLRGVLLAILVTIGLNRRMQRRRVARKL